MEVLQNMTLTELFDDLKEKVILDNVIIEGDVCRISPVIEAHNSCLNCGRKLVVRDGKKGKFWGCSSFPMCKYSKNIDALAERIVFIDLISYYGEKTASILSVIVDIYYDEEFNIPYDSKIQITGVLEVYNGKLQLHCHSINDIKLLDIRSSYTVKKEEWQGHLKGIEKRKENEFTPGTTIRIAVISTDKKDKGYNDFVSKLYNNKVANITPYCISPMTADNIVKKMEEIFSEAFDCIVIVRGGGNYNYSLFDFNNPKLAEAINNADIPVIVGIGHGDDTFLIDDFTYVKAISPTDAAVKINQMYYGDYNKILEYEEIIKEKDQRVKELEEELARLKESQGEMGKDFGE